MDLYDAPLLGFAVGIMLLSILDAAFTLTLLQTGVVEEANPFMRWLIEHDTQIFVNMKIVLTGAAVVFLVLCSNALIAGRFRGRKLLHGVLGLYALVILYEIVLLRLAGIA